MTSPSIFRSDLTWFGTHATRDGLHVMVRGRLFPGTDVERSGLPYAVEVSWSYPPDDATGLPSGEQYELIEAFEKRVIDAIEAAELGITALVHTGSGSAIYLLYLRDSGESFRRLNQLAKDDDPVDFAGDDDPTWDRYRRTMARINGAGQGA